MLDVDLTIPIAILATALVIVIGIRAWASVAERRTEERTAALVRELGLDAPREDPGHAGEAEIADGDASPRSPDEASKA